MLNGIGHIGYGQDRQANVEQASSGHPALEEAS